MPVEAIDRLALELDAEGARVRTDVDRFFSDLLTSSDDARYRLYEAMRHAAIGGGKRLRPLLTVGASRLFALDRTRALRVGCAIEAIHVYSLIHDDLPCMDDADVRRGKPTVHQAFDEAAAVLAGDSLHALAFEILADPRTHEDPWVRSDLVLELAKAAGPSGMAAGQMMDLAAEKQQLDLPSITRLQQLKTGALIEYSVEAACIMAKLPGDARTSYRGYARNIGLAFQIADDIIAHSGADVRRGKPTVHRAFGEAEAVLAGDSLHALAFEILADPRTHEDPWVRSDLVLELAKAAGPSGMAAGQMMDLAAEKQQLDLPSITRLQQLKTGALIEYSVEAACIMAKLPIDARTSYRGYARNIGLAFQIADDIIDHSGSEQAAGKPTGQDALAGKATFVSLLGENRARQQANFLVDQAIEHLSGHGEEADLLRAIARFAIDRDH